MKRLAMAIAVTTTIFMAIPIWALLNDPALLIGDQREVYWTFVILPYSIALGLWAASMRRSKIR